MWEVQTMNNVELTNLRLQIILEMLQKDKNLYEIIKCYLKWEMSKMKTQKQKTKRQKTDAKILALLKKIPKGETMIITETEDGKTATFLTQKQNIKFPFHYIMWGNKNDTNTNTTQEITKQNTSGYDQHTSPVNE